MYPQNPHASTQVAAQARYDAYEIAPVHEHGDTLTVGCCRSFADATAQAAQSSGMAYWSLYGHLPEGGVECVGDYGDFASAASIYARITGLPAPENPEAFQLVGLPIAPVAAGDEIADISAAAMLVHAYAYARDGRSIQWEALNEAYNKARSELGVQRCADIEALYADDDDDVGEDAAA